MSECTRRPWPVLSALRKLKVQGALPSGPFLNLAGNCAALHTGLESAPHRWLQAPCNTCAPVLDQEEFVSTSPIAALLSCTSVPSFPSTLTPPQATLPSPPLPLCPSSNFQNSVSAVRSANEIQARLRVYACSRGIYRCLGAWEYPEYQA